MLSMTSFVDRRLWRCRRFRLPCRGLVAVVVAGLIIASTTGAAPQDGDRPLPEPEAFLERVRTQTLTDQFLLSQYTFIEKRTRVAKGKPDEVTTEVRQVYPAADPDKTYRRLLSVNGEPLGEKEIEEQDRARKDQLAKRARKLVDEAVSERDKRLQEAAEARDEEEELFDEILTLFDFRLVRREIVHGHPTILVSFTPRPDAKPGTRTGRMFSKARGQAWVSEGEYKIVRLEAETIEDVTIGWGVIGRLHKGSAVALQYRKVNDEIWLPAHSGVSGSGRKLLFRTFRFETRTEYSDYKKLTEETAAITALPQ